MNQFELFTTFLQNTLKTINERIEEKKKISEQSKTTKTIKAYDNILLIGIGGSGIAGSCIIDLLHDKTKIPVNISKDYHIPSRVNEKTCCVISSYSGNTEETLAACQRAQQAGASLYITTSGGKLKELAEEHNIPCLPMPQDFQPRMAYPVSLINQLTLLNRAGVIDDFRTQDILTNIIPSLNQQQEKIIADAKKIAKEIVQQTNTIPVVHTCMPFQGLGERFVQQINENGKMLAMHSPIPEKNHNEILGRSKNYNIVALFIDSSYAYTRNRKRTELLKNIIKEHRHDIITITLEGESPLQQLLYGINLTDRISYEIAQIQKVDPIDIKNVIYLKGELKKFEER